jgi:hypothetical protein
LRDLYGSKAVILKDYGGVVRYNKLIGYARGKIPEFSVLNPVIKKVIAS